MAMLFEDYDIETTPEDKAAAHQGNRAAYARNLAAVLGNGAEWEYRGECCELPHATGHCACGHIGLRFLFTLHHPDGRRVIVGSSCVVSYPGITPELAERLTADVEKLLAEGRERKQAAKQAARAAQVQDLLRQWSDAEYAIDAACVAWRNRNPWARWEPQPVGAMGAATDLPPRRVRTADYRTRRGLAPVLPRAGIEDGRRTDQAIAGRNCRLRIRNRASEGGRLMKTARPPAHLQDLFTQGISEADYQAAQAAFRAADIQFAWCIAAREWRALSFGSRFAGECFAVTCRMGIGTAADYVREPSAMVAEMERRKADTAARWDQHEGKPMKRKPQQTYAAYEAQRRAEADDQSARPAEVKPLRPLPDQSALFDRGPEGRRDAEGRRQIDLFA